MKRYKINVVKIVERYFLTLISNLIFVKEETEDKRILVGF